MPLRASGCGLISISGEFEPKVMSAGRQRDRESSPACSQPSDEQHHTRQSAPALRHPVLWAAAGTDPRQSPALGAGREGSVVLRGNRKGMRKRRDWGRAGAVKSRA